MKILYITLDPIESTSSATMRNKGIINGFKKNGHSVDILTMNPSNTNKNNLINLNNGRVYRIGALTAYSKISQSENNNKLKLFLNTVIKKTYQKFFIYNNTYFPAKKIDINILDDFEYDLVISSSDPKTAHIVARELKKQGLKASRWIQYWGDPMSNDITNNVVWPNNILQKAEKNLLSFADTVIYVSPFTLKTQKKLYPEIKHKMMFIPVPYSEEKKDLNTEINTRNKIKIAYLGSYYSNIRDITPLYSTIKKMTNTFELIIAGSTDLSIQNTENITVYPNVEEGEVKKIEEEADIIVCVLNKKGTQIPGKIYHYVGTNKPILVIIDGENGLEIKEYLTKFNRFIFADNNEISISEKLNSKEILQKNKKNKSLSPKNIAHHIEISSNFSFDNNFEDNK